MTCYRPLRGWRSAEPNENGKYPVIFAGVKNRHGDLSQRIDLPCGQCIGCRLERARQWAIRCVHQLHTSDSGCFVTLTFNTETLNERGHYSLDVRDMQLFMKRLRKRCGAGIKVMYSGEYGDDNGRPHYHACLFGVDFDDKKYLKTTSSGEKIYTSEKLSKLWSDPLTRSSYGYSSVGALTFKSAAYVARYCLKKQVGPLVTNGPYSMSVADLDYRTGVITPRKAEFGHASQGLGKDMFERYGHDWYRHGFVVHEGKAQAMPKYYDRQYEKLVDEIVPGSLFNEFEEIKRRRRNAAVENKENNTDARLRVRETVRDARLTRLFRAKSIPGSG